MLMKKQILAAVLVALVALSHRNTAYVLQHCCNTK